LVLADGIQTNLFIQKSIAREANPFLVSLAGEHGLIILKVIGVFACIVILRDIYRRNPRLAS